MTSAPLINTPKNRLNHGESLAANITTFHQPVHTTHGTAVHIMHCLLSGGLRKNSANARTRYKKTSACVQTLRRLSGR